MSSSGSRPARIGFPNPGALPAPTGAPFAGRGFQGGDFATDPTSLVERRVVTVPSLDAVLTPLQRVRLGASQVTLVRQEGTQPLAGFEGKWVQEVGARFEPAVPGAPDAALVTDVWTETTGTGPRIFVRARLPFVDQVAVARCDPQGAPIAVGDLIVVGAASFSVASVVANDVFVGVALSVSDPTTGRLLLRLSPGIV